MGRIGMTIAILGGVALAAMAVPHRAHSEGVEGESKDKKRMGTQGHGGGGGAGAPLAKPKQKMLNPQPEPPGRRKSL